MEATRLNCSIKALTPNLGPYQKEQPVEVTLIFLNTSVDSASVNFAQLGTPPLIVPLDYQNCSDLKSERGTSNEDDNGDYYYNVDDDFTSSCSYKATLSLPASIEPSVQLLTVPNCSGSLPFQFYDVSQLQLAFEPANISATGGNALYVTRTVGSFLQSTNYSKLRLSDNKSSAFVDYPLVLGPQHYTFSQIDSRFFYLGALVDDSIVNYTSVSVSVALDGVNFVPLTTTLPRRGKPLNCLFILSGSSEHFNWDSAQTLGILRTTQYLTSSITSKFISHIDLSMGLSLTYANYTAAITAGEYDVIFLLDPLLSDDQAYDYAKVASDLSPIRSHVVSSSHGTIRPDRKDLSFMWAHVYQARYLSGFLAGLMFKDRPSAKICYLKANDFNISTLDANAFVYGLRKANFANEVYSYTIKSNNVAYESNWAAKEFIKFGCSLFVTNVDSLEGPKVVVREGVYVIGSNVDTRLSLSNDLVLTSAITSWDEMYKRILNTAFNNSLNSIVEFDGYEENAVTLTDFSPFVTNNIRELVNAELKILLDVGPKNRIFVGPVYDNKGKLRIYDETLPSMASVYGMDWTIANVTNLDWKLVYPVHDDNRISNAVMYFFYVLLSIIYAAVCALALWVYLKREHPVIKFAQPVFIYFLLLGILVGISTILPLTYQIPVSDEQAYTLGAENINTLSDPWVDEACQSLGWLMITGYGLTMPVLILKTYRLHMVIVGAKLGGFRKKAGVGIRETYLIVFSYLAFSYFFLGLWQVIDPMVYRIEVLGFDEFNNPIESFGYCAVSSNPAVTASIIILVTFVVLVVLVGNFICFIARNDETVNNEVTYIALSMVNFLQIVLVAGPVMAVLIEKPTPRFMVSAAAVILSFGGLMALIFGPKIIAIAFYDEKSAQFTIRKEGNGIVAGSRKELAPKYGSGGGVQAPPRADDPNSNPASNLAQWRRNSRLATSSSLNPSGSSESSRGLELSVESTRQSTTNPIMADSSETNIEK